MRLPGSSGMHDTVMLWLVAIIAGMLGAGAMFIFHALIQVAQWLLTQHTGSLVEDARALPPWMRALAPAVGGVLAGLVLDLGKRWTDRPHIDYMDAAREGTTALNDRSNAVRAVSSLLSIGSGASIGREGPMVQLSAWFASWLARYYPLREGQGNAILICGIAAGIASAYHAPLAGVVFVLELALGFFARHALAPLLLATVTACTLIFWAVEPRPLYVVPHLPLMPVTPQTLLAALCLGLVSGGLGLLLLKLIELARRGFACVPQLWLRLGLGGLIVGLASVNVPEVWGNGYSEVSTVLAGSVAWKWVAIVLAAKLITTVASTSSGAIGGIFTPTLFVGATSGFLFGVAITVLGVGGMGSDQVSMAIIGMASVLAAVTHAPLMAIVMVLELTGQFQLALPVMLACGVAYAVSTHFGIKPLYGNPIEHHA